METLKRLACNAGLGRATLSQLAFPGEGNQNFPWEKSHWNNTVVIQSEKEKKISNSVRKTRRVADIFPDMLKQRNGAKDWWTENTTLKVGNGTHWWWETSAVIKWCKWHSFERWSQTQIIVQFTSQHSTTWWSNRQLVRKEEGLRIQWRTLYSISIMEITN